VTADIERVTIKPFSREHQNRARALVIEGLRERWGVVDEKKNPDLTDVESQYRDGIFILAWLGDKLVGTGSLKPENPDTARVSRMSVAKGYRRQGIGTEILEYLMKHARSAGFQEIVLETTSSWTDAIHFYRRYGFHIVFETSDETHFVLRLSGE